MTSEKRLRINIHAFREVYDPGEVEKLGSIPGRDKQADALKTKRRAFTTSPLWQMMNNGTLQVQPIGL